MKVFKHKGLYSNYSFIILQANTQLTANYCTTAEMCSTNNFNLYSSSELLVHSYHYGSREKVMKQVK